MFKNIFDHQTSESLNLCVVVAVEIFSSPKSCHHKYSQQSLGQQIFFTTKRLIVSSSNCACLLCWVRCKQMSIELETRGTLMRCIFVIFERCRAKRGERDIPRAARGHATNNSQPPLFFYNMLAAFLAVNLSVYL